MQGKDGGMVNDGAVLGMIDDVHGDELGAERHDVDLGIHRHVGFHHFRDGLSFHSPPRELENRCAVLLRRQSW